MTSEMRDKTESGLSTTQFYTCTEAKVREVADYVTIEADSQLYLGLGSCRVGSKAQLFTMAASGYRAYDQPLKAIFRCLGRGQDPEPVQFPDGPTYFKETVGPYTHHESRFDPLAVLRNRRNDAWLRDHLKVILLMRDPFQTWRSWLDQWGDRLPREDLLHNYVTSFRTIHQIGLRLRTLNWPHLVFDYSRNRAPRDAYESLFESLGLNQVPVVSGWKEDATRSRIETNWKAFKEPEVFLPEGIREDVLNSDGVYHDTDPYDELPDSEVVREEILPKYQFWTDSNGYGF